MTIEMVTANLQGEAAETSRQTFVADELTPERIQALGATLADAIAGGGSVIVDCARTRAFELDAVRMFLAADAAAKAHGAALEFRRVLPPVRSVLEHHGLDWRIQVVDDHGL